MKFEIQTWKVNKLLDLLNDKRVELKPPYQRNFIWTPNEQKELIESIIKNYPLPSFFLYNRPDGVLDMVDGQQRTRTIFRFFNGLIKDKENNVFSNEGHPQFLNFDLSITLITALEEEDSLEIFYARVNKTGKRLNDAELNKAEFNDTNFLKLVEEITESQDFKDLNLFRDITIVRMNDRDFVEEIATLIYLNAFTDKKLSRDRIYKNDINQEESTQIKLKFFEVLAKISVLDNIEPINKSRFRQKNDFYTLFSLIYFHPEIDIESLKYFYNILLIIGKEISPSNETSEALREYAINCVSQSNSKSAREKRYQILNDILFNPKAEATITQLDLIGYFDMEFEVKGLALVKVSDYYTFDLAKLKRTEIN